jgi:hypothetical protein
VRATRVDDVRATVRTDVFLDSRHHRAKQVARADDEAKLFAWVEGKSDREQFNFDLDDLAR